MKTCSDCHQEKALGEFYITNKTCGTISKRCKSCQIKRIKIWSNSKPKAYKCWISLRSRCSNPNDISYHRYGGRGITVCPEWDSFDQFLKDMGPRPTPKHQVDRIDNDGNYCRENCHWVLNTENIKKRCTHVLNEESAKIVRWYYGFAGMSNSEISEIMGVNRATIDDVTSGRSWRIDHV